MPASFSVERIFDVLEVLSDAPGGLSVTELAHRLSMPQSATHRALTALVSRGIVMQPQTGREYRLTLSLPSLGIRFLSGLRISDIFQPVLDELARHSKEHVRLAIGNPDHSLIWLYKAQGADSGVRIDSRSGRPVELHLTAAGKAWLAALPSKDAIAMAQAGGLGKESGELGEHAIRTKKELLAELQAIRERDIAYEIEEGVPGVSALGCVVYATVAAERRMVGALSIAGPTFRMNRERLESYADAIKAAAVKLEKLWPSIQWAAADDSL
ncbi:MAG: IclR family transcriptional regulator protein [Herbaspirillum sp.]|nr:IclR family transcriptional regulator protein [Herbaspirillum sp.]